MRRAVWLTAAVGRENMARELARAAHEVPDRVQQVLDDPRLLEETRRLAEVASGCRYALMVDDLWGSGTGLHGAHALAEAGEGMVTKVVDYRELRVSSLAGRGADLLVVVNADGRRGEALERAAAEGQPFPLVLMDWKMPEMDG